MKAEKAIEQSLHNRDQIKPGTACGCYSCLRVFAGGEVVEWTDRGTTAICPYCSVDAVLPGITDSDVLRSANEHWFGPAPTLRS